ncbi:MAG: phospholipid-binding lipoprotein MlaA [Paracoccaceae bacterium]|jgi:phospholipid-binding lipoprotein MlaA
MRLTQRQFSTACALILTGMLSACAQSGPNQIAPNGVNDPYESANRKVHALNIEVDRLLFRPASKGYVSIIPEPFVTSFTNFSENLSMPSNMVDALLQGDVKTAFHALVRFTINTTVGFAGLADPATTFEIPQVDTDFGEVLHVWGFAEGPYIELPLLGPSNQRDSIGVFVDLFTSPLTFSPVRPVDNIGVWAELLERMGDRGNYSDTIDSILYESADSYAQARVIYLQNRRFELAGDDEDAYLGFYDDPYADPYEDPYAD